MGCGGDRDKGSPECPPPYLSGHASLLWKGEMKLFFRALTSTAQLWAPPFTDPETAKARPTLESSAGPTVPPEGAGPWGPRTVFRAQSLPRKGLAGTWLLGAGVQPWPLKAEAGGLALPVVKTMALGNKGQVLGRGGMGGGSGSPCGRDRCTNSLAKTLHENLDLPNG